MAKKNQWVTIHPKGWAIKGEGNKRAKRKKRGQVSTFDI